MENFVLSRLAYVVYLCVSYVHNLECARKILRTRLKKGKGRLETRQRNPRFVNDKKSGWELDGQKNETWMYT